MSKDPQILDLNVLVVGGTQSGRNQVASLVAGMLTSSGFEDVRLETKGPQAVQGTKSILDVMQEQSPNLFGEPLHVTAGGVVSAFVVDDDMMSDDLGGGSGPNMIMAFVSTDQPATPDDILDKIESEKLLSAGTRTDSAEDAGGKPWNNDISDEAAQADGVADD